MLANYRHSVSNKILLELTANRLSYLVTNRNYLPVESGIYEFTSSHELEAFISDNELFSEIFATVDIIYGNSDFILLPLHLLTKQDAHHLFKLSHALPFSKTLIEGNVNREISILYSINSEINLLLSGQFPNATRRHQVESEYQWLMQKHKLLNESMFLFYENSRLTVFAFKNDKLFLLNTFESENIDDVFFYSMTVVEQVELDVENLTMFWHGEIEGGTVLIKKVFGDFVKTVEANLNVTKPDINNQFGLGIQCLLACESFQEV